MSALRSTQPLKIKRSLERGGCILCGEVGHRSERGCSGLECLFPLSILGIVIFERSIDGKDIRSLDVGFGCVLDLA